jgi:hypothetical protein
MVRILIWELQRLIMIGRLIYLSFVIISDKNIMLRKRTIFLGFHDLKYESLGKYNQSRQTVAS